MKSLPCSTLLILVLLALCTWFQLGAAVPAKTNRLPETVQSMIPKPEPGQFANPEDAARYFLTQIQNQNFDETLRVFPIEQQMRITFQDNARYYKSFSTE